MSFPLPGSGFIELAHITFEDKTPSGYLTDDALWSGYDEAGDAINAANQFRFKDLGGSSGVVAYRLNPTDAGNDRYHIVVLQSGFIRSGTIYEYKTVAVQADMLLSEENSKSNFHMYMRPSGVGHPSMYGFRLLWNRRDDYHGKDYFSLLRMIGGASVTLTGAHGDSKYEVDKTDHISVCGVDDGESLSFYALHPGSGSWEQVFRVAASEYNDHPYSGMFSSVSISNPNIDHALNDVIIHGIPAVDITTKTQSVGGYLEQLSVPSGVSGQVGGYLDSLYVLVTANEEQMQGVWRLDEIDDDAIRVDSSTKGNHLDVIIGSPQQVVGHRDNGTRFQHWQNPFPSLQRTGSGISEGLNPTAGSWTMGMWVNPSGVAYERYSQLAGKGSYDQYVLYIDEEGEVWGQVSIDGIRYVVVSQPSSLIANEWQHVDWIVDRDNQVQYLYHMESTGAPVIIGSGALPDSVKRQDTTTEPFHIGTSPTNQQPFDGSLDEVYFIARALSVDELKSIRRFGLPTVIATGVSGAIGGYMAAPVSVTPMSGQVGGYISGTFLLPTGEVGGYLEQSSVPSGVSGQVGGYVDYDFTSASGQVGGYLLYTGTSGSRSIGGYVVSEGFNEPSAFLSMFTFISPENLDFDVVARIGSAETNDFDAQLRVLRQYTAPTVACFITGSGTLDEFYHVTISGTVAIGDETIQNGAVNGIENVWIQFGDMSGQQDVTPRDGVFEVEHTFTASGVYIIRVDAIDKQGTRGSCQSRVDLSIGLGGGAIIQLDLGGTPQSGVVPHTIAFTQSYDVQPVGIKESIINFGDRTLTHLSDPTHLYHSVGDYIPIWIVRDDNGRFWCDSLVVGVNQ